MLIITLTEFRNQADRAVKHIFINITDEIYLYFSNTSIQGPNPGMGGQSQRSNRPHGGRRQGSHPFYALLRTISR